MAHSAPMPEVLHLTAAQARRVPWKNGRGVTEEIALGPPGTSFEAGDFDWRVSRASVVEAGPFSPFPGLDRVLVVLEGAGLVLTHGAGSAPVTVGPLAPYRFPGEAATSATLLGGPVRDVNVLTRRGRCRAEVEVVRSAAGEHTLALPAGEALLVAVAGAWRARLAGPGAGEPRAWTLSPGDSLWGRALRAPLALALDAGPGAVALRVSVTSAQASDR